MTDDRLAIICGDALTELKKLPDESIQCCVTSPPYWGLRNYGCEGQLGLEKTPEEYVSRLVEVFREVRRVLRNDGTLWLNLGDSYAGSGCGWGGGSISEKSNHHSKVHGDIGPRKSKDQTPPPGLKAKDLVGIPWMVAFALRTDGWWLRQDIIWHKPSIMPESVTDRCTKAHEYIFLLTKSANYYFDNEAIKEPSEYPDDDRKGRSYEHHKSFPTMENNGVRPGNYLDGGRRGYPMRNKRSVWSVTNAGYPGAHFATYPPDLIKPCILAGTSAKGCCSKCGAPWKRIIENTPMIIDRSDRTHELGRTRSSGAMLQPATSKTLGWQPTCKCDAEIRPCTILDPFAGSGTTGMVAFELGRKAILIKLNPKYVDLIKRRVDVTPGLELA